MSHSLFARLAERHGPRETDESRRAFLKQSLLTTTGLLLSGCAASNRSPTATGSRPRIAIIGGGFAGLSCAYELRSAGYDVRVIEARKRVGGRVISFRDLVPGKNVEGGGELIGLNHPTWNFYKQKFTLEFLPVSDPQDEAPIYFLGQRLNADQSNRLWDELSKAQNTINETALRINPDEPWTAANALELDRRNTQSWVDQLDCSPMCKIALAVTLEANNGQALERQSFLGNLAQISGGGGEKYWTESEKFRCAGGNQQLAARFAQSLGDRLWLDCPVTRVSQRGDQFQITCADGRSIEADDVVLAIPPSTWKTIHFDPVLPPALSPQMGVNVKYLAGVKRRYWKDEHLSFDSMTDTFLSMTWEGTEAQAGEDGAELTCFSGGPAAQKARAIPPEQRDEEYARVLEILFPGYRANAANHRFMDWPAEEWTRASYSFPAPGEVTTIGPMLRKGVGRLHFAGEHCCYKFVGYMEGALQSGTSLAIRIAERDGAASAKK